MGVEVTAGGSPETGLSEVLGLSSAHWLSYSSGNANCPSFLFCHKMINQVQCPTELRSRPGTLGERFCWSEVTYRLQWICFYQKAAQPPLHSRASKWTPSLSGDICEREGWVEVESLGTRCHLPLSQLGSAKSNKEMEERETPDTSGMLAANTKQSSSAKVFGNWPCWISDQTLKTWVFSAWSRMFLEKDETPAPVEDTK